MVAREVSVGMGVSILRIPRVEVTSSGHFSSREGSGLVVNVMLLQTPSPLRKSCSLCHVAHDADINR